MDLDLQHKVAIITGASRGIGRAIALRLAQEGMRLVLAARSAEDLQAVAAACPTEAHVFPADLRLEAAPRQLVEFALQQFGTVNLLVNNAGATKRGDFLKLSEADWKDGFALKFFSSVRCCRAAWPHLVRSRGAIVNIVGVGGRTGTAEFAIGGAVNAALLNLTKVLADRGVAEGVRVNAINPGSIATDRLNLRLDQFAQEHQLPRKEAVARLAKQQGIARFGEPTEIAAAVAFLASPRASFCQGSILDVDGGQTRTL
jgi:3-oxoacyl-[acyl-carrier protein] reductase